MTIREEVGDYMFGVYFGKFLLDEGVLTESQYQEIMEENRTKRLKLGPLAILEGYMTEAQAEEINAIQAMKDVRFGDIAVEKGYLSQEQVGALLKKQGDSYLLFMDALTERKILSVDEAMQWLNQFRRKEELTLFELDALKSGDIDRIIPVFTKDASCPVLIQDYMALIARNIVRFIDNKVRFGKIERIPQYRAACMAAQEMDGASNMYIAIGSDGSTGGVQKLASIYAKEEFPTPDLDALDAVCEFINVSNGLFATRLSEDDIEMDMQPPVMKDEPVTIHSGSMMYKLPFYIMGEKADLVICMESKWSIV